MSEVADKIKRIVVEHLGVDEAKVTPEASFIDDLGADSLDTVELVMAFEEEFNVEIPEDAAEKIATVKDAIDYIEKQKASKTCSSDKRERPAVMRRVVVTGMGIACPLGVGVEYVWRRLINAESGIGAITAFDANDSPCKVAGQVPAGRRATGGLDINEWMPVKDQKKMDRFIHLAMVAGSEAVEDSGWVPETEDDRCATGVMIGSGIGGLETIYDASILVHEGKARRLSPFFIPSALSNLASGSPVHQIWLQGTQPLRGDRMRDRGSCDRRRLPLDRPGRRRRDAGRRLGGHGLRDWHRRLLCLSRPVHRLQRPAHAPRHAPGTRTATAS